MKPMTKREFTHKMNVITKENDIAVRHIKADNLIINLIKSLGYTSGAEIYESIPKGHFGYFSK